MKPGVLVTYTDAAGASQDALVTAVVGAGPSTYKIVDLNAGGVLLSDVVHERDHERRGSQGFWSLPSDKPEADSIVSARADHALSIIAAQAVAVAPEAVTDVLDELDIPTAAFFADRGRNR